MSFKNKVSFLEWRFKSILGLISLIVLGLIFRVFDLAILNQHFLRHQGDERVLRLAKTPAFRGVITDRNGFPLAVSSTVYSAWVNPKEFIFSAHHLTRLANLIDLNVTQLKSLIEKKREKEFIYLKRALSEKTAHEIKVLNIPGVYLQEEYQRYYPEGEITAHVVGVTNVDDRGQEGLELAYDNWLKGEPGKKWIVKDRLGRVIADVETVQEQRPGHDIKLSIDRRIQYLAYQELLKGMRESEAGSGSVVVMDVKTGEILAMVNAPSYNPNKRPLMLNGGLRNRAVTDTFEPGSTIKAFSVASVLDAGTITPTTPIDTHPGWIRIGHNLVQDERNNGVITPSQVLQFSSNVGVTKMILSIPPDHLWEVLHGVGFGEVTGVQFPGEQTGILIHRNPWGAFPLATLAFGYGLSVTTLQLAKSYAILANDGFKVVPTLMYQENPPPRISVLKPEVAHEVLNMLEAVLEKGGTGGLARVQGFRVAGKTGTTYKTAQTGGYQKHNYNASFVGVAPLATPRIVIAVALHDLQGKIHSGSRAAAPIFSKIMDGTLRILTIAPDAEA